MKFKSFKKIISQVATGGFLLYLIAFTFIGATLFTPLIGWGIAAVFFAVVVEGTVYAKNIFEAVKNSNYETVLEFALAEEELRKFEHNTADNAFLKDYFKLKKYLHTLSEELPNYDSANKVIAEKNIKDVKRRLKKQVALYRDYMKTGVDQSQLLSNLPHIENKITKENFSDTVKSRKKWMMASIITSIGAGIFSGLSAYALIMLKFLTSPLIIGYLAKIGITVTLASGVGAPLFACLACLGSMFVMYGSASKMIKKGGVSKWLSKMDQLTSSDNKKNNKKNSFKKFLVYAVFPILIILATAAAAWSFCSPILNLAGNITLQTTLRVITAFVWPCMIALTLLFNTDNALESINKVLHDIAAIWELVKKAWQEETFLQFINPFRHIRQLVMLCHAYSMGITTDNLPYIHPAITAFFGMIIEWLTDFHYISDTHGHPKKEAAHTECSDHDENHNEEKDHGHDHKEEENDHDHSSFLLDKPVYVFSCIATVWHFVGGGNYSWDAWQQAKDKFIPSPTVPEIPELSHKIQIYFHHQKLASAAGKYNEKGLTEESKRVAQEKSNAFNAIKTENTSVAGETEKDRLVRLNTAFNAAITPGQILTQHRHGFYSLPKSQCIIEKLRDDALFVRATTR